MGLKSHRISEKGLTIRFGLHRLKETSGLHMLLSLLQLNSSVRVSRLIGP